MNVLYMYIDCKKCIEYTEFSFDCDKNNLQTQIQTFKYRFFNI